jgi:hypothetical protein
LKENQEEKGKIGWPTMKWLGDVQSDLRDLKLKRCRQATNNREEWAAVVYNAKVLRRLQSQGVNK